MTNKKVDFAKFDLEHYVENFAEKDHSKSKPNEAWYKCCFHEEKTASLKVQSKQAWFCHGCGANGGILDFVKKINNIDNKEAIKIVAELSGQEVVYKEVEIIKEPFFLPNNVIATYGYNPDENGNASVYKYRLPNKNFVWAYYDFDEGGWFNGAGNQHIRLYQPNGLHNELILAEGEKDADTLIKLGFNTVSTPHGTGKWRQEYTNELKGVERILIIRDNDYVGLSGAEAAQYHLMAMGIDVKIINAADLVGNDIEKFDVTDAYEILGEELVKVIQEHLDSEDLWNVRWNDETGEIVDVESKVEEIIEPEIVWSSGLDSVEFDDFVLNAVREMIEEGSISLLSTQQVDVWSKKLKITKTSINKTIKDLYEEQKPKYGIDEIESKKMEIANIGNFDIGGSGYIITENGSIRNTDYDREVIGHFLGFAGIVTNAEAESDDNIKIALAYNTPQNLSNIKMVVVPKKSISTSMEIVKALSGYNINVTSANANDVVQYLQDTQNFFNENTNIMKTLNRFGWYKDKLMPYEQKDTDIIFDPTTVQPIANKLTEKVGNREDSLKLIQEIAEYSEANATILGAAVGSLVLSYTNNGGNQSFALNVWNETSTGKSVTCQGVASLFGYPFKDGGWWGDGNATLNKDIHHNALLGNLPNFIDDPARNRGMSSEDKRDYVFAATSGQGRGRMRRDGETSQTVREWCNIMIMTNETVFIDENIADGGARARCLEICFDRVLDIQTVERWIELMRKHHGHFGLELATKIKELGKRYFEEQLKVYVRWFNARGVDGKRAVNASIIQMGLDVVQQALGITAIDNAEWLVREIRGSGSLSDGERAYYKLMEIVEVSTNTYRTMYNRDGVLVGSLGYERPNERGRRVVNLPFNTIRKYAKEHNFNAQSLISWGYANDKMVAVYDRDNKPKPITVENNYSKVDVVQVYYQWDGNQLDISADSGLTDLSILETKEVEQEAIDIG